MHATLLRLGLWTMILILGIYVVREANIDQPWSQLITDALLTQALAVSALLVVAGIVARILGKGAKVITKNRCTVCREPVPSGAIYCRAHLRSILHDEDDKRHLPTRR